VNIEKPKVFCPWCNKEMRVTYEEDRNYKAICYHCEKAVTFKDKSFDSTIETLNRRTQPDNSPEARILVWAAWNALQLLFGIPDAQKASELLMQAMDLMDKQPDNPPLNCDGCVHNGYSMLGKYLGGSKCYACRRNPYTADNYAHKLEKDGDEG